MDHDNKPHVPFHRAVLEDRTILRPRRRIAPCLLPYVLIAACGAPQGSGFDPVENWATPIPQIAFEETTFEFGSVGLGESAIKHRFIMRNDGNAPLIIHGVKKTCCCVVDELSHRILQPGEQGHIDVTLQLCHSSEPSPNACRPASG